MFGYHLKGTSFAAHSLVLNVSVLQALREADSLLLTLVPNQKSLNGLQALNVNASSF